MAATGTPAESGHHVNGSGRTNDVDVNGGKVESLWVLALSSAPDCPPIAPEVPTSSNKWVHWIKIKCDTREGVERPIGFFAPFREVCLLCEASNGCQNPAIQKFQTSCRADMGTVLRQALTVSLCVAVCGRYLCSFPSLTFLSCSCVESHTHNTHFGFDPSACWRSLMS